METQKKKRFGVGRPQSELKIFIENAILSGKTFEEVYVDISKFYTERDRHFTDYLIRQLAQQNWRRVKYLLKKSGRLVED